MFRSTVAVLATSTAPALALQREVRGQGLAQLSKTSGSGLAECPCVGITGIDGAINITIGGSPVLYPSDVGTRCEAWDDGLYSGACEKGGEPGKGHDWCSQKWCYVDPCACEGGSPNKASFEADARYKGNPLYYSYETCGSEDTYTSWLAAQDEKLHQNGKKVKGSHERESDESDVTDSDAAATKTEDESAAGDMTAQAAPTNAEPLEGEAAHPEAAEATEASAGADQTSSRSMSTDGQSDNDPDQKTSKTWTDNDSSKGQHVSAKAWNTPGEQSAHGKSNGWKAVKSAIARKTSSTARNAHKEGSAQKHRLQKQTTDWQRTDGTESGNEEDGGTSTVAAPAEKKITGTWDSSKGGSAQSSKDWTAKVASKSKHETTGDPFYPASKASETMDTSKDSTPKHGKKGDSSSPASKASESWDSSKDGADTKYENRDPPSPESPKEQNKDTSSKKASVTWDSKDGSAQNSEDWTAKVASKSQHGKGADSSSRDASNGHGYWNSPKEATKAVEDVAPLDASGVVPKSAETETAATTGDVDEKDQDKKNEDEKENMDIAGDGPIPTKTHKSNPNFAAMCSRTHDEKVIGKKSCECIGIANKQQGSVELSIEGNLVVFPADLGSTCLAWDQDTHPDCVANDTNAVPDWCQESWCYVDPCGCDQKMVRADKKGGYLPKATADGKQLFYSYKTCGSVDHWTVDNNDAACSNIKSEDECSGDCVWMGKSCKDQMQMDMCGTTDALHSGSWAKCWWQALLFCASASLWTVHF